MEYLLLIVTLAFFIALYCAYTFNAERDYWKNVASMHLNCAHSWKEQCRQKNIEIEALKRKIKTEGM